MYTYEHIEKRVTQKATFSFGNLVNFVSECLHQTVLDIE